jgi:tetratricopeptide (TPR) repeat protein
MARSGPLALALACLIPWTAAAQDAEQRKILEEVRSSVVAIRNEEGHGSGMILDEKGTILTNAHVIVSPLPMRVEVEAKVNGTLRTLYFSKVTLIGVHPSRDLALIRIDPAEHKAELTPLPIAKSAVQTRDAIHAIGFPITHGGMQKIITSGDVTGVNRVVDMPGYFEVSAEVHPGNSGGPVCDSFGHAVGLVTRGVLNGEQIAWAIPLSDLRPDRFVPLDQRAKDPARASTYLRLAERMLKKGEQGSPFGVLFALELFQQALVEDIGNADTYFKLGMIGRAGGKFRMAASYLTRSLQLQAWSEAKQEAYHELGAALTKLGKKSEAEIVWSEGLAKYPTDAGQIWDDLALVHWDAGRYFEAACATRASVRAFGPRADAMHDIYERSRKRMDAATLIRLRNFESSMDEGSARARKDAEQAERDGKKSLTPAFDHFLRTFENVQKDAPNFDFRTLGQGPNPAKDAPIPDAELLPLFIQSRIAAATEHMKGGRLDQAAEILEDVIKTYPDHPDSQTARLYLAVIRKK